MFRRMSWSRPERWSRCGSQIALHLVVGAIVSWSWQGVRGDLVVQEEHTVQGQRVVYQMTVSPAKEPQPPLKYSLVVRASELQKGNAAMHYLRVFPENGIEATIRGLVEKYGESFHDWYRIESVTLEDLPLESAREAAAAFDFQIANYIAPATLKRECDWGLDLDTMRGPDIVAITLPEINASRSISRVLALRARVAIAQGDYERALEELRMNYRLAQNVARQPLLVCALVGIAEASVGNQQVIELMAAKNSPNLYWALAELPSPPIPIQRAAQFDLSLVVRMFPLLESAETAHHAPEEWARLIGNSFITMQELLPEDLGAARAQARWQQAAVAAMSIVVYPAAKQRLLEAGMAPADVEAMPVGQVIAIDTYREYRSVADEIGKWLYVPYHLAKSREAQREVNLHGPAAIARGYGHVLASLLLPAVNAARSAEVRLECQVRALQLVEALRMHAAETGQLPTALEEITVVPVPLNPATNAPYQYRLEEQTAIVELPFSDGVIGTSWRFEIKLDTQK